MESVEEINEVCELKENEESKSDSLNYEKQSRPSHVNLRMKNSFDIESNRDGQLSRPESASLEYAHKYATRIKSFLGWETDVDEFEDKDGIGNSSAKEFNENIVDTNSDSPGTTICENQDHCPHDISEILGASKKIENDIQEKDNTDLLTDGTVLDCSSQPKIECEGVPNEVDENNEETPSNSSSNSNFASASYFTLIGDEKNEVNTCLVEEHEKLSFASSTLIDNSPNNETNREPNSENYVSHNDIINHDEIAEESKEILLIKLNMSEPDKQLYQDFACKDKTSDHKESSLYSLDIKENKFKDNSNSENMHVNSEDSNYLDLNENDLLEKHVEKPEIDDVRRLSLGIIKEVIDAAKNTVHEILANKCKEGKNQDNYTDEKITVNSNKDEGVEKDSKVLSLCFSNTPSNDHGNLKKVLKDSESNITSANEEQNHEKSYEDEETICGFGCFKPKWIQKYATPKIYFLFFACLGVLNGAYYSYFVSIISTLEKKYAFTSKVSGILLLADEITPFVLGIFIGYIGGKTHRPRMVALGMLCAAACCFVSGLPHIIYSSSNHFVIHNQRNETGPEICVDETKTESCDTIDRPPISSVVGIFLLASFLKGFGSLSYIVIGVSYLDDVVKRKNSPFYLAISLALRLLGPLVGFLMSSAFLKIYENPFDDPGFGTDDPRWIGAWWMGFFLQGVLLLIFTVPIALFPRRLPGQKRLEQPSTTTQSGNIRETLAGLLSALKRLAKNPIFIIVIINTTMKIFGHFGHSIMLPKYMENQFRLSAADASLFSGATSIFCIMIATIFGGFMIWKFRPRIKVLLAGMVVSEVMLCIGFLVLMIPRCQPADLSHFGTNDEGLILNSVCNQNCDCSKTSFTPFCGPDGKTTYFSPCYAGCTEELTPLLSSRKQKEFGNCSCLNHITNSSDSKITEGFCPDDSCWSQALAYLIILFILLTLSNTFTVAHTMILLRSVHPSDKSVALGTFETCICLFGFIPFPVTFGALVDSSCLIWEESCGETGNCWFYDMDKFAFLLHGAAAIFCSLSVVCLIAIYVLSSRIKNLYEEEQEEEQKIDNIKLDTTSGSVTAL